MSDIAEKLRAVRNALSEAQIMLISEGWPEDAPSMVEIDQALTKFPDPDAVGICIDHARACAHLDDLGAGVDTALAKLEAQ